MQATPLLLGLDVGTTNLKAILFDPRGQMVAGANSRTPTHYPRPGWAHYDQAFRSVYCQLYTTLAPLHEQIHQLSTPIRP